MKINAKGKDKKCIFTKKKQNKVGPVTYTLPFYFLLDGDLHITQHIEFIICQSDSSQRTAKSFSLTHVPYLIFYVILFMAQGFISGLFRFSLLNIPLLFSSSDSYPCST